MSTIAVIMTVFNRVDLTLRVIDQIKRQCPSNCVLTIDLVDDASTDETSPRVRELHPNVTVIAGSGRLFWAGGMKVAEDHARLRNPDYIVWLNNDVDLKPDALERLLEISRDDVIAVGRMSDSAGRQATYGGLNRIGRDPMRLVQLAVEESEIQAADTFNGNLVLIPRTVYEKVGSIEGRYAHGYADLHYGLRAGKLGIATQVASGFHGICDRNSLEGTWADITLGRRQRLRLLFDRKALPLRSQARYMMNFAGPVWPIYWVTSYAEPVAKILVGK